MASDSGESWKFGTPCATKPALAVSSKLVKRGAATSKSAAVVKVVSACTSEKHLVHIPQKAALRRVEANWTPHPPNMASKPNRVCASAGNVLQVKDSQ